MEMEWQPVHTLIRSGSALFAQTCLSENLGTSRYIFNRQEFAFGILNGQRYINITRNAIGPKSGQKDCRKFKLERSSPIGHKSVFVSFLFYLV